MTNLDPTTGQFSTTAASTITQRDFVAGATVKTFSNLLQAVGTNGQGGNDLGAEDGSITMQIVGKQRHQYVHNPKPIGFSYFAISTLSGNFTCN